MINELDKKITTYFEGSVVQKGLVRAIKSNAVVPTYVLELLLAKHCATDDEASNKTGIETVKEILRKHYVNRKEANRMRSNIKEKVQSKVIDKVSVFFNEKEDAHEANFTNLGVQKVVVSSGTVKEHPILLMHGAWCIAHLAYLARKDKKVSPWILTSSLEPIQSSGFDLDSHVEARKHFTSGEWIDFKIQSIGFNPAMFTKRGKLLLLLRFIPYCERNYNLMELGPKSTAKSHIHSELSHYGILLSGGQVSVPNLFVNNATGKIGLISHRDVVILDEVAGKNKQVDNRLADILKNYTANKTFCRGIETVEADASIVFIGNTQGPIFFLLQHSNLFADLPANFRDSALLDRLHCYIPGWEMNVVREEMFYDGYGLVVDYLAEILHSLRDYDYSDRYDKYFSLSSDISKRDEDGINKTFSGLMKIIYPDDSASKEETEEILQFAIEGRKRVKDHLRRIDDTLPKVAFSYLDKTTGKVKLVSTFEEGKSFDARLNMAANGTGDPENFSITTSKQPLKEWSTIIFQNERGVSFDSMLGPYLRCASKITVTDPYVHHTHQVQNLMEFLGTVVKYKQREVVGVHLTTTEDKFGGELQRNHFEEIKDCFGKVGVDFTWDFDDSTVTRDRDIVTDHGWKIILSRGLDIFRHLEKNDTRPFTHPLQRYRYCEQFEVVFLKNDGSSKF